MDEQDRIEAIKSGLIKLFDNTITGSPTMAVYCDNKTDALYIENLTNRALIAVVEKGTIKMKKSSYFTDFVIEHIAKPYHLNMRLCDVFSVAYRMAQRARHYPSWSCIRFDTTEKKFVFYQR